MSQLDRAFAALADPSRRAILHRLAEGEAFVGDLATLTGLSQPAVSRHLKILESAGLISSRIAAQSRPRALRPDALAEVRDDLSRMAARWEENFARLDTVLAQMQQERD